MFICDSEVTVQVCGHTRQVMQKLKPVNSHDTTQLISIQSQHSFRNAEYAKRAVAIRDMLGPLITSLYTSQTHVEHKRSLLQLRCPCAKQGVVTSNTLVMEGMCAIAGGSAHGRTASRAHSR
jgi:hypothetical protein